MTTKRNPKDVLKHYVTGAIERGEATAVKEKREYEVVIRVLAESTEDAANVACEFLNQGGEADAVRLAVCERCDLGPDHFLHTTAAADCKGCQAKHDHHKFRAKDVV